MRITNVGYNHYHDADFFINRPAGSGDYLVLLLKTPAVFMIDGVQFRAEADSVIYYNKGTPQFYKADGAQFGNDWFHFLPDNEMDERFLAALDIPFDKIIKLDSVAELSVFINMMCYENYSANLFKADSVDLLVKLFFIKLSEKMNTSANKDLATWHKKLSILRTKIYNMPSHNWNIDGLAHEVTASRSSFQHMYKKTFGTTPMNDVVTSRIEHAKYLLSSTDYTITYIAQMCGYSSDTHFMRQFKNKTGMTPSAYRIEKLNEKR
ncbi:AraC family transcriptional regulator [Ruminococcus sp. Marseille-P6503]|uniref:helix-turn-helix transcriptional regulator n=1 Tax=Ruminococcus sp. Marseille-P6503 TaxID=2364796 RepID=UPI000F520212|nr:AraC family transcriptional regulator [Ruminococcus sp. Marseille-P6503]